MRGRVLLPGDDGFDDASRPWNVAVPQRPDAVVHVADEQDVVAVVRVAREQGFVVSAQPGGHGATTALDGTVLLRTGALDEVVVDRAAGIARVGAGVKWGQLLAALDGTGLIAMAGSNPDVSVVGYLLGGGLSWFGRRYGIGSRSLRAAHIVDGGRQRPVGRRRIRPRPDVGAAWWRGRVRHRHRGGGRAAPRSRRCTVGS